MQKLRTDNFRSEDCEGTKAYKTERKRKKKATVKSQRANKRKK